MDPYLLIAQRGSPALRTAAYDERFIYSGNGHIPDLAITTDRSDVVYGEERLFQMRTDLQSKIMIPKEENFLREQANPLSTLPEFIKGDADLLVFRRIFGFDADTIIIRTSDSLLDRIVAMVEKSESGENQRISDVLIIKVDDMKSKLDADTLYLTSMLYGKITLLQPAISSSRYLIAFNRLAESLSQTVFDIFREISTALKETKLPLTGLFRYLPEAFGRWLHDVNNFYISVNNQIAINLLNAKNAFDRRKHFWLGISYDRKRLLSTLYGGPLGQQVIDTPNIERKMEIDEEAVRSDIHLWANSELREGQDLHTVLDFDTDDREAYVSRRGETKGGDHHGQRKLFLSELEFLVENLDTDEQAIIIYIGAAPGSHINLFLRWFDNVKFWLIDPREDAFDRKMFEEVAGAGKIMITTDYYDADFAQRLTAIAGDELDFDVAFPELSEKTRYKEKYGLFRRGVTKFFFWSDIRRTSATNVSRIQHEVQVKDDMALQLTGLAELEQAVGSDNFLAMLKFRPPFIGDDDFSYMAGELRTQVWAPLESAELRLIGRPSDRQTVYSKKAIEEIMFYHNKYLRNSSYGPTNIEGYGSCHDCHREVNILKRYFLKYEDDGTREIDEEVSWIGNEINVFFGVDLISHASKSAKVSNYFSKLLDVNGEDTLDPFIENQRMFAFRDIEREFVRLAQKIISEDRKNLKLAHKMFVVYSMYVREDTRSCFLREDNADVLFTANIDDIPNAKDAMVLCIRDVFGDKFNPDVIQTRLLEPWFEFIAERIPTLKSRIENNYIPLPVSYSYDKKQKTVSFSTTGGRGKVYETDKFDHNIIYRFMTGKERPMNYKPIQLFNQSEIVNRAYCILIRYKLIFLRTMTQFPFEFYDSHEQLPGLQCGATLLSTAQLSEKVNAKQHDFSEEFCSTQVDYELAFTNKVSPFAKGFHAEYFSDNVVTVFPPNITALNLALTQKWIEVLEMKDDLAVLFIFEEGSITKTLEGKSLYYKSFKLESKLFDTRFGSGKIKPGEDRVVVVLKTENSEFEI